MRDVVLLCWPPGRGTEAAVLNALPAFDDVAEIPEACPNCRRALPDEADLSRAPGVVSWQPCQCVVCLPCAWKELVRIKGSGNRPCCPHCGRFRCGCSHRGRLLPPPPSVLSKPSWHPEKAASWLSCSLTIDVYIIFNR